jgi:hypothetical protein
MKKNLLSALLLITIGTQAQTIVNAGFENYKTNTTEEPVGWIPKVNSLGGVGNYKLAVKSTDAHSGTAAVLIRNIDPDLGSFFSPFSLELDDAAINPTFDLANKRPAGLKAWVKFHRGDLAQADSVFFDFTFFSTSVIIGDVSLLVAPPQDVYTEITIPISYTAAGGGIAALGSISTVFSDGITPGVGAAADSTTMLLDDLSFFGTTTGLDDEEMVAKAPKLLYNVTPNHFAIEHTLSEPGTITINVFDVLGKEVVLPLEQPLPAGTFRSQADLSNLSPAIYFIVFDSPTTGRKTFMVTII